VGELQRFTVSISIYVPWNYGEHTGQVLGFTTFSCLITGVERLTMELG
jgi:hypothetical protein